MATGGRVFFRLIVLSLILFLGGSVFSFYSLLYEQSGIPDSSVVLVEKGENLTQIARRLKKDDLISSVSVFKVAARLLGKATQLKAGEYRIPAYSSIKEILDILVSGQTVVRRVTIPEGKTSQQIFEILVQTNGLTGNLPVIPPNGALLPETYTFSYGMPRKIIVKRMLSGMQRTIDELWPDRDDDLPYTTKEEALVLASIIEKETSVGSERPRIAGVFINRLRKGMRLQTDPTVIYAVTNGTMELKRRLTYADLKKPHPFNTYVNKGLPPAPICNPGRESIKAVLRPQKTDEIYFVADGTGGHVFARSFDEHRRNIANWKKVRQQKKEAAQKAKTAETALQTAEPKQDDSVVQEDLSLDIIDGELNEPPLEKVSETPVIKPEKQAVVVEKVAEKKKPVTETSVKTTKSSDKKPIKKEVKESVKKTAEKKTSAGKAPEKKNTSAAVKTKSGKKKQ